MKNFYLNFQIMPKFIFAPHLDIHLFGHSFGNVRCGQSPRLSAADHLASVRLRPFTDPFDTPLGEKKIFADKFVFFSSKKF
jgi:hypothetical protein